MNKSTHGLLRESNKIEVSFMCKNLGFDKSCTYYQGRADIDQCEHATLGFCTFKEAQIDKMQRMLKAVGR